MKIMNNKFFKIMTKTALDAFEANILDIIIIL